MTGVPAGGKPEDGVCTGCGRSAPEVEFPPYGRKCRECRRSASRADRFLRTDARKEANKKHQAAQRDAATPGYVRQRLAMQVGVTTDQIPMELAEAASALLRLKRKLKGRGDGRQ